MYNFLCVVLTSLFLQIVIAADTQTPFTAVVVEGRVSSDKAPADIVDLYQKAINQAHSKKDDVDIIVLPEYGLTNLQTEDLDKYSIAINDFDTSETGKALKGLIQTYKKAYLVANLLEKDSNDYYSTTVVLDSTGKLIKQYRKINVNETEKNLKSGRDIATFEAPFGVVGLLAGDDILHENPAQKILKDNNVTTVVYTTAFKSSVPFKSALSVQQGYAQTNNINLLVANLNDPANGFGGSGIYSQNKILASYISSSTATQGLSAVVDVLKDEKCPKPVKFQNSLLTNTPILGASPISKFQVDYLPGDLVFENVTNNLYDTKRCDDKFCCTFTIKGKWKETYSTVVSGRKKKICALVLCDNDGKNCGKRTDGIKTKFSEILITTQKNDTVFRPYTLTSALTTISNPDKNTYFCRDDKVVFQLIPTFDISDLVVFGIVTADSAANTLTAMIGINLIALFIAFIHYF